MKVPKLDFLNKPVKKSGSSSNPDRRSRQASRCHCRVHHCNSARFWRRSWLQLFQLCTHISSRCFWARIFVLGLGQIFTGTRINWAWMKFFVQRFYCLRRSEFQCWRRSRKQKSFIIALKISKNLPKKNKLNK